MISCEKSVSILVLFSVTRFRMPELRIGLDFPRFAACERICFLTSLSSPISGPFVVIKRSERGDSLEISLAQEVMLLGASAVNSTSFEELTKNSHDDSKRLDGKVDETSQLRVGGKQ